MGCEVYANGDEIACKAGDGKVNASAPDVCMSPPSPPAGPIPVPYMDSSFSKDMKNGSKTVKIKGKEVMLKDKSFYKTSPLGNEAATRSFGANVISHVITGKTYFIMWSMDVKFEGLNVDRHDDIAVGGHRVLDRRQRVAAVAEQLGGDQRLLGAERGAGERHPRVAAQRRRPVDRLERERHLRPRALGACHVGVLGGG